MIERQIRSAVIEASAVAADPNEVAAPQRRGDLGRFDDPKNGIEAHSTGWNAEIGDSSC